MKAAGLLNQVLPEVWDTDMSQDGQNSVVTGWSIFGCHSEI